MTIPSSVFDELKTLDTCVVSNAIERLNVRLRNEGFVTGSIRCRYPHLPPMLGYAVPARVRTSSAPMTGRCYYDRMDWWQYVASMPEPRVLVLQDADHVQGFAALVGEVHATIAKALNCSGCVTDGAVRDLDAVEALGFPLFAKRTSVSHSYAHIAEFGDPVEIGGLLFHPGDLVHGDRNGIQIIPLDSAPEIPRMVRKIRNQESELIEWCKSRDFSLEGLGERISSVSKDAGAL